MQTTPRHSHRTRAALAALALVVTFAASACLTPSQSAVHTELNKDRTENSLRSLPIQNEAQAKAQRWAEKLARENRLYHSQLKDGFGPGWCSLGENVGYGPSVPAIEDAYMASPGHRANILASKWTGVGVGYAKNGSRVFTVQVFYRAC
jgi:uncharacterized protein YkwD